MDIGIEIRLEDGSTEWLDPVDEAEFDKMLLEATDEYVVSVVAHDYTYAVKDVVNIEKYALHHCCGFDDRGGHSRHCVNNGVA